MCPGPYPADPFGVSSQRLDAESLVRHAPELRGHENLEPKPREKTKRIWEKERAYEVATSQILIVWSRLALTMCVSPGRNRELETEWSWSYSVLVHR
jgi:hypothetical protein